ncbi:E3 ubiquitin-protein ligase UPL2 isoform X1 [Amborella trichopoda]|uniref:HECT-type E3 ubiquitin transferase n=1 Tax=Amborella trichopoda TaxID=13333 RepID=U5CMH7_AMBTC|nr:E3 ubiquitin-protein ligase UPL2 isoform X1 [Amborella trichopoda]ERN14346.1 hypothetical protein AMTR_s00033p00211330 [Amborella trichopoda]|eukprot:XP_006852879.1 E3 ubiquitin-protein ligase UPL2 isoform X1 [Amborella trichopoda]
MGSILASPPLRLRQILSGEATMRPSVKLDTEPPPKIKAFIDRVIKSPLSDIAIPLSGFHWEYNKGNFHHWRPLFLHFDTYFKSYVCCRKDLLLSDNMTGEDALFPKHAVLQILRVMQIILENCHNKSSFSGLEHFNLLLSSTDPEILLATLQTLASLVRINPSKLHVNGKLLGCGVLNNCLLALAQGWGSKEEGLGLFSCVVANERNKEEGLCLFPSEAENNSDKTQYRLGSTLHFEFQVPAWQQRDDGTSHASTSLCVIHMEDLNLRQEDDLAILNQLVDQYNVPQEQRFSLLTRIRYARAFRSVRISRQYSRICLLAFIVLVQSSDAHEELVAFFANEPECTVELINLVRSVHAVPENIRTLAMLALGAQLAAYSSSHERARILSGSSIISAGGNRMLLLSVLQKAVMSLSSPTDPSSVLFVDAMLHFFLLHVISSSSSGSGIRGSGLVPALLPLLQDNHPGHMHLVCTAVKIIQKLMDYSNVAVTLFRDLGGLEFLIQRLQVELSRVIDASSLNDKSPSIGEALIFDDEMLFSQKRLIKTLLKALGSATYTASNSSRPQSSYETSLPASLSLIFRNAKRFGGDIYASGVTVMSEIIHKDPTCFPILYESGLPNAFLSSVTEGILPSSRAVSCVPNGLGAVCLNPKGLEAVKEQNALRFLITIFTSRKYLVALNEGIVPLANAVEELLRHVSSLRGTGVDIIVEILEKLACLGEGSCSGASSSEPIDENTAMETDPEERETDGGMDLVEAMDGTTDGVSCERFVQLCIFHVMVLVHRAVENAETCRLFVEKKGIEAIMKLLLRPSIAQSSEGMSIAVHTTAVFKGFTQQHSSTLAQAFCSHLRDHLKQALDGLSPVAGSFLLAPGISPRKDIFSGLFVIEFLLFLADASRENRWMAALLNEFGNGGKDVLEDIGRLHREVLWQIALLEDSKVNVKDENGASSSSGGSQGLENTSTGDADEPRFSPFRQLLDPLFRRQRLPSGWSAESQFFDLISLYRDFGRATGFHQRSAGMDGSSSSRFGSGARQLTGPSEGVTPTGATGDKEKSYHTSCCDMMRSLSFHISHLFSELGKSMLLPSRRRDDSPNVSSSAKSVVSTMATILLDNLNFGGHLDPSKSDSFVSTKCRYLGKVIDFIDAIILDRPESCNPILVNCFYVRGVIHVILTTFEATSQLLFTVIRPPTSPMETEDGNPRQDGRDDTDHSWIYGPLASYTLLMDHLVTSSFIYSPFTKHLLCQPLISGNVAIPRDAEAFVRVLQSKVLKAILPIWNHPQFSECNLEFVSSIFSIIRHVYSGVDVKSVNSSTAGRLAGPPPDESTISVIVEMGFSRSRAEEALRQVGTNSVEMAMEWLFSHPEEAQEDDELARALAMSLGNSGSSGKEDAVANTGTSEQEEESVQPPPIDDLLMTCVRLLQLKDSLTFSVRDLLVMMCSRNDGNCRPKVVTFVIDHIKLSSGNTTLLSALFHVLALVLHEDTASREVAAKHGLTGIALNLLAQWHPSSLDGDKTHVPKWVTASLLAIDEMLQVDPKPSSEISDQSRKDETKTENSLVNDENASSNKLQTSLGLTARHTTLPEQKRLIEIACGFIRDQLPSETMHVVLQLCATLTRVHAVSVTFLEAGGLHSLLSLPTVSLFSGFDNVAATIVRHILEDPHTLQQAMESEIRHSLVAALNRNSNGRVTPRNFLTGLASVITRDPAVFMLAAQSVCQIEMVGERPYVVLLKDREKEKSKDKDKPSDKDKNLQSLEGKSPTGDTPSKASDTSVKSSKAHRKSPQSFITVIELLLDSIVAFVPSLKDVSQTDGASSSVDMEIDEISSKGKGKAIAAAPCEDKSDSNQEASASLAKNVFILKLLTEILLTYSSSVHVLLRRDAEISCSRGGPQRGSSATGIRGVFYHVLHKLLPSPGNQKKDKKSDGDWRQKLATRSSQFLLAASIRSAEARRRIFSEISNVFNDFVGSSGSDEFRAPDCKMQSFIDLINEILAARSPTGSYISAEVAATFSEVGLVRSLTRTLQILDLDHPDSPKLVTAIVKALEAVTKEQVQSADSHSAKVDTPTNPGSNSEELRGSENGNGVGQTSEPPAQPASNQMATEQLESFGGALTSGGSDSVTDDMEHDRDDAPDAEDDYMHDNSEEAGGLGNGVSTVGISFDIQHDGHDDHEIDEDDDEEMSGGEEVDEDEDEDEEDNDDLDEDEVHHLSHPDTDQDDHDDHEIDEDEFDEDVLEEDEDEDEDDENGLIVRLEDGINGINVLDHFEVLGRDSNFPNDSLRVMPVEVFGSRRQGRTTSIYNLLGRAGDHGVPLRHPLLIEPSTSSQSMTLRQSEISGDMAFSDRNFDNASSRLDAIFRSLRSGRHGNRFSIWADDSQQRGGPNASTIAQGIEELFISQLRRPTPDQPSNQAATTTPPTHDKMEANQMQDTELGVAEEAPVDTGNTTNSESGVIRSSNPAVVDASGDAGMVCPSSEHGFLQGTDAPHSQGEPPIEMQCERTDAAVQDVEAVSQESGGSGATLGESLRSLEVEIGSADGHDDGGDRHAPSERMTLGVRRPSVPMQASSRDVSLQSVSEVSREPSQEGAEQNERAEENQNNANMESASIDPAFLDALPEELRAEVLSAQQNQVAQPPAEQPQTNGDIDPEFLAALPPDIRAEVLAQQQAQRLHQSQELEGQPVEMDTVSIIATFPSDLREEVLLTSSDAILANLTPALVAEANMLRERFAHRYHGGTLFGMFPRNRRGESSGRGDTGPSSLDRGGIVSRRSNGSKLVEADGAPLVDTDALKAMIRLLRVVQPLYKGQLQRLLLNLCAHRETRTALVQLLMDMLMLDERGMGSTSTYAGEPSYRLYACPNNVIYSRPQFLDGVPPLVSRRVLEVLIYLARNHPYVAKLLLHLKLPQPSLKKSNLSDQARGKAVMILDDDQEEMKLKGDVSIVLLLSLLNQPLYSRSVAHLEQLLNLLEVIMDNAESESNLSNKSGGSQLEQPSASQSALPDSQANASNVGSSSTEEVKPIETDEDSRPSASGTSDENNVSAVLCDLPTLELRLLCSLLAREGLSDNAYVLIAEVIKKLVAIASTHCRLFISELADSIQSLSQSAITELRSYGEAEDMLLSTSSTDGTAILRVLQALSSLVSSLLEREKEAQVLSEREQNDPIMQVWDLNAALEPLWQELSICISKIESSSSDGLPTLSGSSPSTSTSVVPPLPAGTQNILPYIESFFVTCEKLGPGQLGPGYDFANVSTPEAEDASQKSSASHSKVDDKHGAFVKFSEKHRKLLNSFIRQNPGLLEKSFSIMLKVPRFIDFDNKRAHFRSKIKHQHDHHHSPLRISVRRAYILEDSYNQLRMRSTQDLKGRLTVHFQGEEGIDAGGLTREWYQLLSRVIFDKGALLFTTVGNESTFQPNPNSVFQTEHLSYFKFVGRVVAKALFDGQLLDVHFTRSFYKHILGAKVTYHDIEAIDPDFFKNLKWMLENDTSDILDLTFSVDADEEKLILYERTEVTDYELIPGGRNVRVTEENKHEYVDLVAEHKLTTAIRPQINAFMEGFNELIPRELISIFHDKELELLISGLPDIDLDDLRANTEYSGYSAASPVIQWFWEVVNGFSKEDKARLLQFVTGTSKVPLEGFRALQGISGSQRFQIHKAYGSPDHLPSAHTCFNQLDLPEYPTKQQLQERLLLAIHEGNEGFGFG